MKKKAQIKLLSSIKNNINTLHWTLLLALTALFLLACRQMYTTLDYLSTGSVASILATVSFLMLAVFALSKSTAQNSIALIDDYSERNRALMETATKIHEINHIDVLLEAILDNSIKITGAHGGAIIMAKRDELVFDIVKGADADTLRGMTFPKHSGIAGWVLDNGVSQRVDNIAEDKRHYNPLDKQSSGSLICVPLKVSEDVIGVIELVSNTASAFGEDDVELLSYFGCQAAHALMQARFREDIKNFEIHFTNNLIEAVERVTGKEGHHRRVAKYSLMVGHAFKLGEQKLEQLYKAALLHDIGLLKMDTNNIVSQQQYDEHAKLGYNILSQINLFKDVAEIVLHHHERYDGKGFPAGIKGEDIPLMSRIITIAEVFDTIIINSQTEHDETINLDEEGNSRIDFNKAIGELQSFSGEKYDPYLVNLLLQNIHEEEIDIDSIHTRTYNPAQKRFS